MVKIKNRSQLIKVLAKRAFCANIGFFVGTGFSMAINSKTSNFENLVRHIYNTPKIDDDKEFPDYDKDRLEHPEKFIGKSFPQLVEEMEKDKGRDLVLKVVVDQCSISVGNKAFNKRNMEEVANDDNEIKKVKHAFLSISPQWAITTNYDLVLEQLVEGSKTIGPRDFLPVSAKKIPIFHIHGHIREPENIVISEKDYTDFLSCNEYRRQKLSSLLAESTVVFMGYSLGDINVRTALKQAKQFAMENKSKKSKNLYVVFSHDKKSLDDSKDPVEFDEDMGAYILRVNALKNIINEIGEETERLKKQKKKRVEALKTIRYQIETSTNMCLRVLDEMKRDSDDELIKKGEIFQDILDDYWKIYSNMKNTPNQRDDAALKIINIVKIMIGQDVVLLLSPKIIYKIVLMLNQFFYESNKYLHLIVKEDIHPKVYKEIQSIIIANEFSVF